METRYIRLSEISDVKEFVNAAEKCDYDIDISYNRFIIDAKSMIGVLSLDLSKILKVEYRGFDQYFEDVIKRYEI